MKTKRIKLRGWFLVVLRSLLIILMFFMACESNELSVMIYKSLFCLILMLPIVYLLIKYGD